jgi:hypothetical protein
MADAYRNLLKTSSRNLKMGKVRIVATAAVAATILIWSAVQLRSELAIMGLLIAYISFQNYRIYNLSDKIFDGIEELSEEMGKSRGM